VLNYLEHHRVWNESSPFKVVAHNAAARPNASSALGKTDGHPDVCVALSLFEQNPDRFLILVDLAGDIRARPADRVVVPMEGVLHLRREFKLSQFIATFKF
jgi:hypothetical protein